MGKIVAVTGAAGYVGRVLLQRLTQQEWVEHVVAIDTQPIVSDSRTIAYAFDIRDHAFLRAVLAEHGVTNFVHAAFLTSQPVGMTPDQMRAINVEGSQAALKTAYELHVEQVMFISSVSVYGYRAGNPSLVKEDHRLWSNMTYGQHKVMVETYLRGLARHYPATHTTIIRPAAVAGTVGRQVSPLMALIAKPFFVVSGGGKAFTQAIHEDDCARLITKAIEVNAPGTFNAAPDDRASWLDIARLSGRRVIAVPRILLTLLAKLRPLFPELQGFTTEIVDYFSETLVADNTLARQTFGWSPRYTTLDTFADLFAVNQPASPHQVVLENIKRLQNKEP